MYVRQFWMGNTSDICLHTQTHTLLNHPNFMGTPNSMRILYNNFLLTAYSATGHTDLIRCRQ